MDTSSLHAAGDSDKISLLSLLFAKIQPPQLFQLFHTGLEIQTLHDLRCPSLDRLQHLNGLLELKYPGLFRPRVFPPPLFIFEDACNLFYHSDSLAGRDLARSTAHAGAQTHPEEKATAQCIPTSWHHPLQAYGSARNHLTSAKPCGSRPPPINQRNIGSGPGTASGPSCGTDGAAGLRDRLLNRARRGGRGRARPEQSIAERVRREGWAGE